MPSAALSDFTTDELHALLRAVDLWLARGFGQTPLTYAAATSAELKLRTELQRRAPDDAGGLPRG